MSPGAVWLVVGVQAAGKSTIAQGLAEVHERAIHVRGDQLRRWAVTGWVQPGDPDADEVRRLLDLRYRVSASIADECCAAGFTTIVQDNIYGGDVVRWLDRVVARPRHLVVLRPRPDVVAAREAARRSATGKIAYRPGGPAIEELDAALATVPRIGLWLDTSDLTPAATVAEIVRRRDEAVVP
jgi:predicted kinase